MADTIATKSEELINTFNDITGDDKAQAMVVISTLENDSNALSVLCAGTASMMMSIQATALAQNFDHLVKEGSIEKPMLLMMNLITDLTRLMDQSITQARSEKAHPECHQAAGTH